MGVLWIVAAAVVVLFAGNPATWYEGPRLDAVQTVYQDGVPHTDRQGRDLTAYDPQRSFFPIGIYHAVDGEFRGRRFDLSVARDAGFNAVHTWEGQPLETAATAASRNGLQLVYHYPTETEAAAWRDNPAVLAWYLDEDPTIRNWDPDWAKRLDAFQRRKAALQAQDPDRAVFPIDGPFIDPPRRERWLAWNDAGDISAHWNYPVRNSTLASLGGRRGIPETVATAVSLNGERKPHWLVVQAFSSDRLGWRMPSAREIRAMVYAGLIHGATGIFYFSLDSFATRDGQVLGVAPWTEETYGPSPDYDGDGRYPLVVSQAEVAQSQALWRDISVLNHEIAGLAPALLSPTSRLGYTVHTERGDAPVRTLLKQSGQTLTLFVVNIDAAPVAARIEFADDVALVEQLAGERGTLDSPLAGFGTRVFRLTLRTP